MSEKIMHWLASQHDAMLGLIEKVVNIDSGSYDKAGVDAVGEVFSDFFASHGIEVERLPRDVSGDIFRARVAGPGNAPIVLMGHRDTVFRALRLIRTNDEIAVATHCGRFTCRVTSTQIVEPGTIQVLRPTKSDVLTLVTCFPFYFMGPAPQRFIVRAKRVGADSQRR